MQKGFLRVLVFTLLVIHLTFFSFFSSAQGIDPVYYNPDRYKSQRQLYIDTNLAIDKNDLSNVPANVKELKNYPLIGYLYYRLFVINLAQKTPKQVTLFQNKFQSYPFSEGLPNRYLRSLVKTNSYKSFIEYQKTPPKDVELACFYYRAKLYNGDSPATVWQDAQQLWLNGKPLPNSCEPLIAYYRKSGKLDDVLNLARFQLAFTEEQPTIMAHLLKQINNVKIKKIANDIDSLYKKPAELSEFSKKYAAQKGMPDLIIKAYKRLARVNRPQAIAQYDAIFENKQFTNEQKQQAAENAINYLINHGLPGSQRRWRDAKLAKSTNSDLIYRRFRLAIRDVNWNDMEYWLHALPETEKSKLRYSYWQARILIHKKQIKEAKVIFKQMLGVQDIYSAMAAVHLGEKIRYPEAGSVYQPEQLNLVADAIIRVHELFAINRKLTAQIEWQYLNKSLDNKAQQLALANYAKLAGKQNNDFYNLAVATTINGKLWDQRDLRFPLAYYDLYQKYGQVYDVPVTTMMALSRQESVFNASIQSNAGAIGLMQLMPATAKMLANQLGVPMDGNEALKDPELNIQLGAAYLKKQLSDFDNNRVYAFASYNAGPSRVTSWQAQTDKRLDVFSFIESIPFNETRGYVQNLLMFETYYQQLLKKPVYLFTPSELKAKY